MPDWNKRAGTGLAVAAADNIKRELRMKNRGFIMFIPVNML